MSNENEIVPAEEVEVQELHEPIRFDVRAFRIRQLARKYTDRCGIPEQDWLCGQGEKDLENG